MKIRFLKYSIVLIIPAIACFSINSSGYQTFTALIFIYALIPLLEFFFAEDETNLEQAEEEMMVQDKTYDFLLYLMVPVQYGVLFFFIWTMSTYQHTTMEMIGKTLAMGVTCGALGINIAHELGHRKGQLEQLLAKALLLTSMYMHFNIEHNRGHHKNVSTPEDPSSARYGEMVFVFWLRSIVMAYLSAWHIENDRLKGKGKSVFSLNNEMMRFQLIQLAFVVLIYFGFGLIPTVCFLAAALVGILQLETVNYIEHYGLARTQKESGRYERVQPWHSWNSNHILGRLFLFELSRHSDHHYLASRKYQVLRHFDKSPQMPTGYPGMMLLSLFPPLWFGVMNKRVHEVREKIKS